MNLPELTMECAKALLAGQHITLSLPAGGKLPPRFPRGELLSVGTNGSRNVRHDPLKVLAWVQQSILAARAVIGDLMPSDTTTLTPETPTT